jgi:4-diphosphocytidyl-2-C-methyl-D-erythritol kinase
MHDGVPVPGPQIPDALLRALRGDDVAELGAALSNDLQEPALRLRPELRDALERGLAASARGAILSGSGPSCLFLCEGRAHAERVADALSGHRLGPVSCAPAPVQGARVVDRVVAEGA